MKPTVSVIIPCFNQARYLPECIASLQAQTYPHWEGIVVNDGSPDNTKDVALRLAQLDNRIRYVEQGNSGLASARNLGIQVAHGKYLQFLDADDLLLPTKFELQLKLLLQAPETDLAYCDFAYFEGDDPSITSPSSDFYKDRLGTPNPWQTLLSGNLMCVHAALVKRSAVIDAGGFDTNLWAAEDYDLWLRLAHQGHHFVGMREVLVLYRRVAKSMSSNSVRQNAAAIKALLKVPSYAADLSKEEERLWKNRIAQEYLWQVSLILKKENRPAEAFANALNCLRYSKRLGITAVHRWATGIILKTINRHLLWRLRRDTNISQ